MHLKPRNPRQDRLVNEPLAVYSYFQIGTLKKATLVKLQKHQIQMINAPGTELISVFSRNNPVLCRFHRLFHSHGAGGLVSADVCWPALPVGGRPPSRFAGQLRARMGGAGSNAFDSYQANVFVRRLTSCVPTDLRPEAVPGVHVLHCVFRQY